VSPTCRACPAENARAALLQPMSRYQEFCPAGPLAPYIECLWTLTPEPLDGSARPDRIYPDGAADVVVAPGKRAAVHGPAGSFRLVSVGNPTLGMRIRVGAAAAVLGVSPTELQSGPLTVSMLWGKLGSELDEQLSTETNPAYCAAILTRALTRRLANGARLDEAVLATVERVRRSPEVSVRRLASDAGLCERHLRRRFENHVGMSIKQYARISRFQGLLDAIRRHRRHRGALSPGWATLSCDYGYADQAHLIREVRAFAGLTPGELLQSL